jgi:hypothetical protein
MKALWEIFGYGNIPKKKPGPQFTLGVRREKVKYARMVQDKLDADKKCRSRRRGGRKKLTLERACEQVAHDLDPNGRGTRYKSDSLRKIYQQAIRDRWFEFTYDPEDNLT